MKWTKAESGARLLLVVSSFFAVAALTTTFAMIETDRAGTIREVRQRNVVMAQLLEEHARRAFDVAKVSLVDLAGMVMASGKPEFTPDVAARMSAWINDIPQISSFWLIDADGRVVHTTQPVETAGIDFSNREYFKAHLEGVDFHIGRMTRGRLDRIWFFSLSKRLVDRNGNFQGVLLASMRIDYFAGLYERLGLGPNDNISVMRSDGAIVVRRLASDWTGEVGPSATDHPIITQYLPKATSGDFEAKSPIDQVVRLGAYRVVEGWPLIVTSASDKDHVLARWRVRAIRSGAYCAAVLFTLGLLTWWGYRRIRGEARALATASAMASHLTELNNALTAASAAKSRVFAAANHDLRQPFQTARLLYDVLSIKITDADQRQVLDRLGDSMNCIETLLNELLDVAKLDSGSVSVKRELVALGGIVRNVVAHLAPLAANKNLELRVFTGDDRQVVIDTDPLLLKRVLLNLVSNAIRYTEFGSVLVGMRRRDDHLAIEVWDTGIGVAPEDQELVFEEFYQVGNEARNRSEGTGLGLTIVRRLCDLLHYEVNMASRLGRGSVFRVLIPLACPQTGDGISAHAP